MLSFTEGLRKVPALNIKATCFWTLPNLPDMHFEMYFETATLWYFWVRVQEAKHLIKLSQGRAGKPISWDQSSEIVGEIACWYLEILELLDDTQAACRLMSYQWATQRIDKRESELPKLVLVTGVMKMMSLFYYPTVSKTLPPKRLHPTVSAFQQGHIADTQRL